MKKKILVVVLLAILITILGLTLVGCENTDSVIVYTKNDEGIAALKTFKGTSGVLSYTVESSYLDTPVTKIDDFALANNEYLETIIIGKDVSSIGSWAFTNSPSLRKIEVSVDNTHFKSVNGVLYNFDMTALIAFPNKNTTDFVIPEGVTIVAENAMYLCRNLQTVQLPSTLLTLSSRAMQKCIAVTALDLPSGLKSIGVDGLSYMSSLKDLFIPASVTSLDSHALWAINNPELKAIRFEAASLDGIALGKDWQPKNSQGFVKIPLTFSNTRGGTQ